jgi:hypothetical protein
MTRAPLSLLLLPLAAATCGHEPTDAREEPTAAVRIEPATVPADLGERALAHAAAVVAFGARDTGSRGWQQALDYVAGQLTGLGLQPLRDRWTEPGENLAFENISVVLPGKLTDRILIACHHDTKCCAGHDDPAHNFEFVGANDSGSGVGLLLALAETLRARPRQATIELVFFDGEESRTWAWNQGARALFGSRRYVERYREQQLLGHGGGRIRALVLLDMVGSKDLQIDDDVNSDRRLHGIFRAAAQQAGHATVFFKSEMAVSDDHLPFLRAGIPAIDLIDIADNPQWHTADDTLEHLSAESLQIVGAVVLHALPAIEREFVPERGGLQLRSGR